MAQIVLVAAAEAFAVSAGLGYLATTALTVAATYVGSAVDRMLFGSKVNVQGPRLQDLSLQTSTEGANLPIVYGTIRIAGNVIWSTGLTETSTTESIGGGGSGGGGGSSSTTYSYSTDCAVALCEGTITGVRRIWADTKLIYDVGSSATLETLQASAVNNIRFYTGSETQLCDPLIQAVEGTDLAYRGTAYVVFEDFQLANYGNRLPNFSFEVVKNGTTSYKSSKRHNTANSITFSNKSTMTKIDEYNNMHIVVLGTNNYYYYYLLGTNDSQIKLQKSFINNGVAPPANFPLTQKSYSSTPGIFYHPGWNSSVLAFSSTDESPVRAIYLPNENNWYTRITGVCEKNGIIYIIGKSTTSGNSPQYLRVYVGTLGTYTTSYTDVNTIITASNLNTMPQTISSSNYGDIIDVYDEGIICFNTTNNTVYRFDSNNIYVDSISLSPYVNGANPILIGFDSYYSAIYIPGTGDRIKRLDFKNPYSIVDQAVSAPLPSYFVLNNTLIVPSLIFKDDIYYVYYIGSNDSNSGNTATFSTIPLVATSSPTLKSVVDDIVTKTPISASKINFAALSGDTLRGYASRTSTNAAGMLESLITGYNFDLVEENGTLMAKKRGTSTSSRSINSNDLGATIDG
jgi:hypothetical protein